jgi:serine protease Do
MRTFRFTSLTVILVALLVLAACVPGVGTLTAGLPAAARAALATTVPSSTASLPSDTGTAAPSGPATSGPSATGTAAPLATPAPASSGGAAGLANVGDLQIALEQIYDNVNASVVNIMVTEGQSVTGTEVIPNLPGTPNAPNGQNPHAPGGPVPLPLQALGSGFVWDQQGRIVTNNHVVDGATKVTVTFADGAEVPATVVGTDPDSDLAVIKVDPTGLNLKPVVVGDSTKVRPGQFVVAIGNPFGLEGSMSFGIVSALGRSLPAQANATLTGPTFTIPDIIQTDAPINPGNSGGVLLDLQGQLVGVPTAIESAQRSNSGVGFAVPAAIVQNVVPQLIQSGKAQHPYLGISGTTLGPELAQAMNLPATQRGALVVDVTPGGPAEAGGVKGSTQRVTINGVDARVGGDVIVRIDNQPVTRFEDLPAYLANSTKVGQTVTLTVLRNGKETPLKVTLANRPSQVTTAGQATPRAGQATPQAQGTPGAQATPFAQSTPQNQSTPQGGLATPQAQATPSAQTTPQGGLATPQSGMATPQAGSGTPWLGVSVINLSSEVAQAMNLDANQQGVLIESVAPNSPAQKAGLRGSTQAFSPSRGPAIQIGGDIITAVGGQVVTSVQDLSTMIQAGKPGQKIVVTVLRNGSSQDVSVTLEARPATQ